MVPSFVHVAIGCTFWDERRTEVSVKEEKDGTCSIVRLEELRGKEIEGQEEDTGCNIPKGKLTGLVSDGGVDTEALLR